MRPKSRSELRSQIIDVLYKYINTHDDLLEAEKSFLNEGLRMLICADCHLFHLKVSHKVAFSREKNLIKVTISPGAPSEEDVLPF